MQVCQQFTQRILSYLIITSLLIPSLFLLTERRLQASSAQQGQSAATVAWFDPARNFRLPLQVAVGAYPRLDYPAEATINFTELLNLAGQSGSVDLASLRLVELNGATVIDDHVRFQFDPAEGYDATTNALGTLVFLLAGNSPANTMRTFHLYFERMSSGVTFTAPNFPDQVVMTATTDEGQQALQVATVQATYLYQTAAGGFSSILDANNNDWINYHPEPAASAGGAYRGIPNMVYPEGGLHPGATGHTTSIRHDGPLKATIHTTVNTDDDAAKWKIEWAFFPNFARATVLERDHAYWFLYEGTPGGTFDANQDFVVRADGATTSVSDQWTADFPGEEWLYFADPAINRALYLVNHTEDSAIDSYRPMSDSGGTMTVFGFGRRGVRTLLTEANRVFTIGLVDSTAYGTVAPTIRGAYRPVNLTVGAVEMAGSNTQAQITIVEDAQPNARRNFRFDGDLGVFKLDDPKSDDGDAYGQSHSVTVAEGSYTVRQSAATGWYLAAVNCTPASAATVQLASRSVQINIQNGAQVSCTFVNLKETTLRIQRLDGQSARAVTLFREDGVSTLSGQSNHYGKLSFATLLPGNYTLCVEDQPDCTPVTLTGDQLTLVTIPTTHDNVTVTNTPVLDIEEEAWIEEEFSAEDNAIVDGNGEPTAVDAEEQWLNTPILQHQLYLPFISSVEPLE